MSLTHKAKDLLWSYGQFWRYAIPNPLVSLPAASGRALAWEEALRRDGCARIECETFRAVAEHVERTYFSDRSVSPPLFARDTNTEKYRGFGVEQLDEISFRDPGIAPLVLNEDLAAVYFRYYGRQPYFRNQPVVQRLHYREGQPKLTDHGNRHHTDPLRQLSLMLLVSDATESGTHMVYAAGSHRRPMWRKGIYLPYDEAERIARHSRTIRCTGRKGTLFLFDACGVHRRILSDGKRLMLHLNITTGHHLKPMQDTFDGWAALESSPRHIMRMFYPPRHIAS